MRLFLRLIAALLLAGVAQAQNYRNVCGLQDTYKCMNNLRNSLVMPKQQLEQPDFEINKQELRTKCS